MNKVMIYLGLFLVCSSILIFSTLALSNESSKKIIVKCYDNYNNEIIGAKCYEDVNSEFITYAGILNVMGLALYIWGFLDD